MLAGYRAEHDHLIPDTWRRHAWSSNGAYGTATQAATGAGTLERRHNETLWISPHCLGATTDDDGQLDLFGGAS